MFASRSESGFTLIEAVIAAALAALIVAAVGAMVASSLRSVGERRIEQSAAIEAGNALEELRGITYSDLEHDGADSTLGGMTSVDPDGAGPVAAEQLVMGPGGVTPSVLTRVANGVTLTVTRYVTWVDDDPADSLFEDYKRVSVLVSWTSRDIAREHRVEAIVTDFGITGSTPTTIPAGPGGDLELTPENPSVVGIQEQEMVQGFTLTNGGPDDRFNLVATKPAGASYTVAFYRDFTGNGVLDPGDNLLSDTNADLEVDTGFTPVATGSSLDLLAVWTPTTSDAAGLHSIQITAETFDAGITDTSNIEFTLSAAGSGTTLFLHNNPSPPTGDTTVIRDLGMDTTAPTSSTLFNFSTDEDGDPGRYIKEGGTVTTTTKNKMANWVFELTETATYNGTARATFWVAMSDFNNSESAEIRVLVRHKDSSNNGNGTTLGDTTFTHVGTGGWEPVVLDFPVNTTIAAGEWLELKVIVNNAGTGAIYVAYEATGYPASLVMP